ncbi:IclR family acetate operon transcriptional repressor [Rhodococcus sp. OAS809]
MTDARGAGVQTVTRALTMLTCFRSGEELGVSEVARRQELAVSTTHRLLQSLVDAGFLEKDDATSRYRIGAALAAYGQVSYRQHRIYLSEPYLEQLAATTGASASLAVRSGSEVVLLGFSRWREADGHVLQGVRLPLHASALGKAFLAWSDVDDSELAALPREATTQRAITDVAGIRRELELTRERGYGFNDEELTPDFRTIGIPIIDGSGTVRYALGLRGPVELMIDERIPFLADLAKVTARQIGEVLLRRDVKALVADPAERDYR